MSLVIMDVNAASPEDTVVLVVEDEPALLDVTCQSLQLLGCRVLAAESAEQALVLMRESKVDLLFTDLRLGGLGGGGLIAQAIARDPGLHVVATSALLEELDAVRDQWGRRVRYLLKPYDRVVLRALLAVETGRAG